MTRMDEWLDWLNPEDIPAAIHLLDEMEKFGQMRSDEAGEWRRRIRGWERLQRHSRLAVDPERSWSRAGCAPRPSRRIAATRAELAAHHTRKVVASASPENADAFRGSLEVLE